MNLGATDTVIRQALHKVGAVQEVTSEAAERLAMWRKASGVSLRDASKRALVSVDRLHRAEKGTASLSGEEVDRLKTFYWKTVKNNLREALPDLATGEALSRRCWADLMTMLGGQ